MLAVGVQAAITNVPDANIGAGLVLVAVQAVGAAVWAALEARHGVRVLPLLVRWALVAVVAPLASSVANRFLEGPNPDIFWDDVVSPSPCLTSVVLVPALLGAAVGYAIGSISRRRDTGHS